ncbi:MAG: thioredoxin family protein [Phycisphaerales bacterium]
MTSLATPTSIVALLAIGLARGSAEGQSTPPAPIAPSAPSAPTSPPPNPASQPAAATITFVTDFDAALEQAKREQKPLFVEFMRPGCPYCAKMQSQVYPLPATQAFSKRVVWVRVNTHSEAGARLVQQFKIGATPTYLALGHDGRTAYFRYDGALRAAGFLHSVSVLDPASSQVLRGEMPKDRDATPAELLGHARAALIDGDGAKAQELLRRLVDGDPSNGSALADDALLLLGEIANGTMTSDGVDDAYRDWMRILKSMPTSDRAPDAALYMRKVLIALGQEDKASALQKLLAKYPADVDIQACLNLIDPPKPAAPTHS